MTALPMTLMSDEEVARLGRNEDAGFGVLQTARGLLPLAAMDVDARVVGTIASIELAQTFVNTTGTAIEATYIFPLPDRARFARVVGAAFSMRRKTLRNSLRGLAGPAEFEAAGIEPGRRPETLSPAEFAKLAAQPAIVAESL